MENVLPSLITTIPRNSSHDCMVRAICEIAKTPENEDGLLGDFFNMLLTPWYVIENVSEHDQSDENDFLQAQRRGHFMQDCSAYEHNCAISIFEVCNISFFIGIVASIGPGARSSACRTIFAYSCVKYVKIENLTEYSTLLISKVDTFETFSYQHKAIKLDFIAFRRLHSLMYKMRFDIYSQ